MNRDELEAFWRNSKSNAKIWKMRSRTILAAMPTMSGRSGCEGLDEKIEEIEELLND